MADLKELFEKGELSGTRMARNVIEPVYTGIRMSKHVVQYVKGNKAPYIVCIDGVEYKMRLDVNNAAVRIIDNTMCDVFVGEFSDETGYELVSAIPCSINEHNASKKKTRAEEAEDAKEQEKVNSNRSFELFLQTMREMAEKEGKGYGKKS